MGPSSTNQLSYFSEVSVPWLWDCLIFKKWLSYTISQNGLNNLPFTSFVLLQVLSLLLFFFLSSEVFFRLKPVTYVIPNSNPVSLINGNIIEKLLEFKENLNEEEMDKLRIIYEVSLLGLDYTSGFFNKCYCGLWKLFDGKAQMDSCMDNSDCQSYEYSLPYHHSFNSIVLHPFHQLGLHPVCVPLLIPHIHPNHYLVN